MTTAEYVCQQFDDLHQRIDVVMLDMTEHNFNWAPPGTANAISTTFLHILNAEDFHIQTILQGKARVWESGGWSEAIGVSMPPGRGQHWEETRRKALGLATVLGYQQAVRAATDAYFAELTDEKLGDRVNFAGDARLVAEVLTALVIHLAGHAGEIAAVKGMQGLPGLPF